MRVKLYKIRKKILFSVLLLGVIGIVIFLTKSYSVSRDSRLSIDSLNLLSHQYRYLDADKSMDYAHKAAKIAYENKYSDGYYEALNNELIIHCLFVNSNKADSLYNVIQSKARNQVELLVAEVYMMKMCAITSRNLDFFDYYNRALQRINRINEENNSLDNHYELRMSYIELEFHLTAAETFCNLLQREQALYEISKIDVNGIVRNSPYLWMQYCFILGFNKLVPEQSERLKIVRSFDYLMQTHTIAVSEKAFSFQSLVLSAISELLINKQYNKILIEERPAVLNYLYSFYTSNDVSDTIILRSLPDVLSSVALRLAQNYGSPLLEAELHRVRGNVMFADGDYSMALFSLEAALSCLNHHHEISYPQIINDKLLEAYSNDSVSLDIEWTESRHIHTSSLCLAKIREKLSVVYMALNDKQKSDYNRNIYIDLLEITRKDLSLESRYARLKDREKTLNSLLFFIIIFILLVIIATVVYARIWRKRTIVQVDMLRRMSKWLTSIVVTDINSYDLSIHNKNNSWLEKEKNVMESILQPYREWMQKNKQVAESLRFEETHILELHSSMKLKIAQNKRKNLSKRAKVALVHSITPFLDRMLREINRIVINPEDHPDDRLNYIDELAEKINKYNDVLTEWIKMNKGELSLYVESFELQQIFDIIYKGRYLFEQKNIQFNVDSTDVCVKADKALTLFMISTLVENARKFTDNGGSVSLRAIDQGDTITVIVEDTGCGLLKEELDLILNTKIYDASVIGSSDSDTKARKGFGFGLLNCKGIISEYKKMGGIFSVCDMNIRSTKGKGSIFSFILPKGRLLICVIFLMFRTICSFGADIHADFKYATQYADSIYFSNLNSEYSRSLSFADSVFFYLNKYYYPYLPDKCKNELLSKYSLNSTQELVWWENSFKADYHLIMSVRNEIAIAALALHKWDLYDYNNKLYTRFYKILGQNDALEDFYNKKEVATNNTSIAIVLLIVLFMAFFIVFYIIYFRRRILFRLGLMKVLEVNKEMLNKTEQYADNYQKDCLMENLLKDTFEGLKEIHDIEGIRMMIIDDKNNVYGTYTYGILKYDIITNNLLEDTCKTAHQVYHPSLHINVYPLMISFSDDKKVNLGAIALNYGEYTLQNENIVLEEYIMTYLSIMIYETVICRTRYQEALEIAEDEKRKTEYEEGRIRVQNQILDNCLSSIKHESMYYPSRIRQIVKYIKNSTNDKKQDYIRSLYELAEYYKSIYMLLSSHADRQIDTDYFVCRPVKILTLAENWKKRAQKRVLRFKLDTVTDFLISSHDCNSLSVSADDTLLDEMIDLITDDFLKRIDKNKSNVSFTFEIKEESNFIKFSFSLTALIFTKEEIEELFVPDVNHYTYLLCKEIIREHDKLSNYSGCRISIESYDEKTILCFTLPKA